MLVESTTGRVTALGFDLLSERHTLFLPIRRAWTFQSEKRVVDPSLSHSSQRLMDPLFHRGNRYGYP